MAERLIVLLPEGSTGMPWYNFALEGLTVPKEQDPEWHSSEVAAIAAAAQIAGELVRNRHQEPSPVVLASRVTLSHPSSVVAPFLS